jgi:hypothetical protein
MEIQVDDAGWKMKNLFASEPSKNDVTKHVYLVQGAGYVHNENIYETFDNVNGNAREFWKNNMRKMQIWKKTRHLERKRHDRKTLKAQEKERRACAENYKCVFFIF